MSSVSPAKMYLTPVSPAFCKSVTITAHTALPPEIQKAAMERMFAYLTDKRVGALRMVPITGDPSRLVLTCTILSEEEVASGKRPIQYIRDHAYTIMRSLRKTVGCVNGPYLTVQQQ